MLATIAEAVTGSMQGMLISLRAVSLAFGMSFRLRRNGLRSAMFISVLKVRRISGALLGGVVVDRFGLDATLASSGCAALATTTPVWIFG